MAMSDALKKIASKWEKESSKILILSFVGLAISIVVASRTDTIPLSRPWIKQVLGISGVWSAFSTVYLRFLAAVKSEKSREATQKMHEAIARVEERVTLLTSDTNPELDFRAISN